MVNFSYLPLQWIPVQDIDNDIDLNLFRKTLKLLIQRSLGGQIKKK